MTNIESLKKVIYHLLKEDDKTTSFLLKEDKNLLRSFVRHCIHEVRLEISSFKNKENLIRQSVRALLKEAEATGGSPDAPSDITSINFLKNLLKNIVPNLEEDYKELTSAKKQRMSFRKHILNAVENLLNSLDADPEAIESELEEVTIKVDDDKPEGFIDIYDGEKDQDTMNTKDLDPEDEFSVGLQDRDLDKTGRNAAFESFKKVQNQVENEYSKLDPEAQIDGREETERQIFRDYLLLNLKLYFDKFEEDLSPAPEEPDTPSEDEYIKAGQSRSGEQEAEEVPAI
tara:strand:+ start:1059 stop:1919 length:861 start_codon:yes stop_codon:yes gene_type:complete